MPFPVDRLVFSPHNVDLSRSPLAGRIGAETRVLGAFNPGLTRLDNGNLLLMVRIAEALVEPVFDGHAHSLRWREQGCVLDAWPLSRVVLDDPRVVKVKGEGGGSDALALTSLSWLLPVELAPDGLSVVAVHYDRAVVPSADFQCYGIEDPRISRIDDRWWMTVCSVSPARQGTSLYVSDNGLDWHFVDLILDHQNKDMLLFEGRIDGTAWAQTRPLGDAWFAWPPDSELRAGPSINLATSPDLLHWKPSTRPGIHPHAATRQTARIGGGAPPIPTARGWLSLWHGVEPGESVGIYRTFWSILDADDPGTVVATEHVPLLEANPALTAPLADLMYLDDIVFTTGIVDAGDHFIVASGEADLACRITHIPKARFGL